MYRAEWKIVKPKPGRPLREWETHTHNGKILHTRESLKAIKIPNGYKIYHAHGEYEIDAYALIDPARFGKTKPIL